MHAIELLGAGLARAAEALGHAQRQVDGAIIRLHGASQVTITAKVSLVPESTGFGLSVELTGSAPNLTRDQLGGFTDKAHGVCPYSKATKGNMPVTLLVA